MGGRQSLSFTDVYKRVNIKINKEVKEQGGLKPFNETTLQYVTKGFPTGFEGVSLIKGNSIQDFIFKEESEEDYNYSWNLRISDQDKSSSYLYWGGYIEYSGTDKLRISADIDVNVDGKFDYSDVFPDTEYKEVGIPYLTLKWSLSLDSKYITNGGNWSDAAVINEYYLDPTGKQKFEIEAEYRDIVAGSEDGDYNLKIYIPTMHEYHLTNTNITSLITAFKALSTTTLVDGTRRITRYEAYSQIGSDAQSYTSGYSLYFYALVYYAPNEAVEASNDHTIIEPSDYNVTTNRVKWKLVKSVYINSLNTKPIGVAISNAKFEHLPSGLKPLTESTISQINNINNKLELDYDLNLYDLDNAITNDENTYVNYLKKSDSSPTVSWTKTGETVTNTIQKQVLDRIVEWTKIARNRIQGSIKSDTQITSLNVLRDPTDSNRIYYPLGISYNDYKNEYSGEVLEMGSDDVVLTEAHSSGHTNAGHS
jgi:hypothetical protein